MPEEKPSTLSNVLAVVGLILVLIIVLWGLIHLATLLSPKFSSLFASKPPTTVSVQAPANATSGEAFTLRWSYEPSVNGSFALVYPCGSDLRFETAVGVIPCGAGYALSGNDLSVTPYLSGATSTQTQLTVVFAPSGSSEAKAQGTASITVHPSAKPTPVVKKPNTSTGSFYGSAGTSGGVAPVGPSDLAVTLISAGIDGSGWGTVVFDIANNGKSSTGAYSFQVYLPTMQTYTYYSPTQVSLAPGSHIVNTLRFTQAVTGAVSIVVDSDSQTQDTNRTNNYAGAQLTAPYGYQAQPYDPNGYYPQPYVY